MSTAANTREPERTAARRFFVETWGCQMNERDSQRLTGALMEEGLLPTREPAEADVILLNSCSVREKAEQKVYSRLGRYRRLKSDRPGLVIGLCGCVAQEAGERALSRVPDLDFVLGPGRVAEIREALERRRKGERPVLTGFPAERDYAFDSISRESSFKGMVTIVEGCDKNCTFCIVPQTRGPERSRGMAEILDEVRHLVDFGFSEIELLGQTVNHWRQPGGEEDFADLLNAVARTPGVARLRFVTSYPRDFTDRMVEQFGRHPNICPALHLPVQSGSDPVLQRMGRGYSADAYRELARRLKATRPGVALSTDIIVGFPGETEEDFALTLQLLEELEFAQVFAFTYSPRPGTAAPRLGGDVEPEEAAERLQRLFALQEPIQRRLNEALVGEHVEVVVTGLGKRPGMLTGRTSCHRVVHFEPDPSLVSGLGSSTVPLKAGRLTSVVVRQAYAHSLLAEPIARVA
ncbi:MAG: tRNA (N6-isopentenyl adenosine(37)-C2)-methylthiotransferase MiaB [Acidobacteriota bacterium]|nr:tRNA (N6-isopentenyl adenosine(37)-C2)-methylthiotransferase MiaB [Acidobacteriota bacterium]